MLAVFSPQSQTSFPLSPAGANSPSQAGQPTLFEISIVAKDMSLKSQTISLPFNGEPAPEISLMASMACMAPIMPGVAPRTPRVLHVCSSLSERFGIMHSKQGVSGGAKTDKLPSTPIAAPKTYGTLIFGAEIGRAHV